MQTTITKYVIVTAKTKKKYINTIFATEKEANEMLDDMLRPYGENSEWHGQFKVMEIHETIESPENTESATAIQKV
jgi:hypothetical protein